MASDLENDALESSTRNDEDGDAPKCSSSKSPIKFRRRARQAPRPRKTNKRSGDGGSGAEDDPEASVPQFGFVKPLFKSPKQIDLIRAYEARDDRAAERRSARAAVEEARRSLDRALAKERAASEALAEATKEVFSLELKEPCRWNNMLGRLEKFVEVHGHCRMSHNKSFDESVKEEKELKELSIWVMQQKGNHKRGTGVIRRAPHRVKALERLGITWTEAFEDRWSKRFERLREYQREHGHCNVSKHEDVDLHTWVGNQRSDYMRTLVGKTSGMTEDRIRSLESIGFQWRAVFNNCPANADRWQFMYDRLKEYRDANGHVNVPLPSKCHHDKDLRQLSLWLRYQRESRAKEQFAKNPERLEALRALGFEFPLSKDDTWVQRLQELIEFKAAAGHCRVPTTYPKSPKLHIWSKNLRADISRLSRGEKNKLSAYPERLEMLKNAGFDLSTDGGFS